MYGGFILVYNIHFTWYVVCSCMEQDSRFPSCTSPYTILSIHNSLLAEVIDLELQCVLITAQDFTEEKIIFDEPRGRVC